MRENIIGLLTFAAVIGALWWAADYRSDELVEVKKRCAELTSETSGDLFNYCLNQHDRFYRSHLPSFHTHDFRSWMPHALDLNQAEDTCTQIHGVRNQDTRQFRDCLRNEYDRARSI